MRDVRRYQLIALLAALLVIVVVFIRPKPTVAPTNNAPLNGNTNSVNENVNAGSASNTNQPTSNSNGITFYTEDLSDADPKLHFSAKIASSWVAEYDNSLKAIIFSDPKITSGSSQKLRVTYYESTDFTSPAQTTVGDPKSLTVNGKQARSFTIKGSATDQPWSDQVRQVIDMKTSQERLMYRFEFGPTVTQSEIDQIINALDLSV